MLTFKSVEMHQDLSLCLKLTQQLVSLAGSEHWSEMQNIASEREKLIEHYFSFDPLPDEPQVIDDFIMKILNTDLAVTKIIQDKKKTSITESLNLKNVNFALKQYSKVGKQ